MSDTTSKSALLPLSQLLGPSTGDPKRVMLLPGTLDPNAAVAPEYSESLRLTVLAFSRKSAEEWRRIQPLAEVLEHAALRRHGEVGGEVQHEIYADFFDSLLSDARTHYLVEREWVPGLRGESVFNLLPQLGAVAWNACALFAARKPEIVVAHSTPHLVEPWIVCHLAERLSIPVVMTAEALLPGHAWLVSGVDEQRVVAGLGDKCEQLAVLVRRFVSDRQEGYAQGAPPVHRNSLEKSRSGGWSPRVEWSEFRRHLSEAPSLRSLPPRAIYAVGKSFARRQLWSSYRASTATPPQTRGILTQFLHYQPERTTLPEAGRFGNQFEFARLLAHALPNGWILQIREHPATFVGPGPFHPGFRSSRLYDALASLPNTYLLGLSQDPFSIIDDSSVIATATGTVGLEALCRNTPVIVAGKAQYRDAPGVLDISTPPYASVHRIRDFLEGHGSLDEDLAGRIGSYLIGRVDHAVSAEMGEILHGIAARDAAHSAVVGRLMAALSEAAMGPSSDRHSPGGHQP